jgi:hypothetical protein
VNGSDRRLGLVGLVALLAAMAGSRLASFSEAFPGGLLAPVGDGDSFYHLGRILRAVADFPRVPVFDPLMNWPEGGLCPWADGYDVMGAAFALATGAGRSPEAASVAALLWPVVLGLLGTWATVDLARLVTPPDHGPLLPLAAGMLAAFMPVSAGHSAFGYTDHHVLEMLVMALLGGWALRRVPRPAGRGAALAWEAGGAVGCGVALWSFGGSVLYCGLAVTVLVAIQALERDPPALVGSGAIALLGGALLGAGLTLPALRQHGKVLSFAFPSLLQPGVVALGGVAVAALVAAGRLLGPGRRLERIGVALGAFLGVAGAAQLVVPRLGGQIQSAVTGWLLHQDPWLATVDEFQPLFRLAGHSGPVGGTVYLLGLAGLILPVTMVAGVREALRADRARAWGLAWLTGVLVALTIVSARFSRVAVPFIAVVTALSLGAAARLVKHSIARRFLPPCAAALLLAAGGAAGAWAGRSRSDASRQLTRPVVGAAREMQIRGPPAPGARSGVLVPWDWAHAISVVSGRPVVANGFGSYMDEAAFQIAERAFLGDEEALLEVMERRDLGYVVGGFVVLPYVRRGGGDPWRGEPARWDPAFLERSPLVALLLGGSGIPESSVPHLSRLMPRHASAESATHLATPVPLVWTYERVPGARLAGRAPPWFRVVAEIELRENGRSSTYRAWADAAADGTWSMRVALPSGPGAAGVRGGPAWRVTVAPGRVVDVAVPESAVREGREVPVGRAP